MSIPILMYHSVGSNNNPLSVTENNFESQMKLMKFLKYDTINFDDLSFNNNYKKKFIITFDDGYEDVFYNALPILKKYNYTAVCYFVTDLIGKYNKWDENKKNFIKLNLMNIEQIKIWFKSGMYIGGHSSSHSNLLFLNSTKKKNEIANPKKFFKEKLYIDINLFSYPFGKYDKETIKIIRDNYSYAVTTNRSRYKVGKFNNLEIPRIPINNNTSLFKFLLKTKTIYEDIKYKTNVSF